MKRPIIAIIGRANVGKSTLFNRFCGRQKAIVHDMPGVTRDRLYSEGHAGNLRFTVIDTGGLELTEDAFMPENVRAQAMTAIREADGLVFLCDGRTPPTEADLTIARFVREAQKPAVLAVNKIDGPRYEDGIYEYYALGIEPLIAISGQHANNVEEMMQNLFDQIRARDPLAVGEEVPVAGDEVEGDELELPDDADLFGAAAAEVDEEVEYTDEQLAEIEKRHARSIQRLIDLPLPPALNVAIVGKPNVGKSTLLNRLLGEERAIVSDVPGTTRDAIDCELNYKDRRYVIVDTAGLRRRRSVETDTEFYSVRRTLNAIDRAHVVIFMISATETISDQDAKIAGYVAERGRACIVVANKWDLGKDELSIEEYKRDVMYKLRFVSYAPFITISALTGQRAFTVLDYATRVFANSRTVASTSEFNRVLHKLQGRHSAPTYNGRILKFYFGAQTAVTPPTFRIKMNYPHGMHYSYERYLVNGIREAFGFEGVPVRLKFEARRRSASKNLLGSNKMPREKMGKKPSHKRHATTRKPG